GEIRCCWIARPSSGCCQSSEYVLPFQTSASGVSENREANAGCGTSEIAPSAGMRIDVNVPASDQTATKSTPSLAATKLVPGDVSAMPPFGSSSVPLSVIL